MPYILRIALIPGILLLLMSLPSAQRTGAITSFTETFDGAPSSPTAWNPPGWDVTVHSRDGHTWYQLEPMNAAFGPDCAPLPATHVISSYEDAVFQCGNRVMTAIQAEGNGVIYLTPNQLVDLSAGEAVVRFDLSTLRTSSRDWVDLWVSPYADHLQLPLDNGVDLQGYPLNALHIRMGQTGLNNEWTFFGGTMVTNFVTTTLTVLTSPYEHVLTPDTERQDTFELRLSKSHVRFGLPQYDLWWIDTAIPELGWDKGVVQFGHHSFNPTKCDQGQTCTANTWQWDNVTISPAVPLTFIKGLRPYLNQDQPQMMLASSAPEGGKLRFTAWGRGLEMSLDGGQTWQTPRVQPAQFQFEHHFQSYWMDIPAGTWRVRFRSNDPESLLWLVRDLSVWYPTTVELPPPTSTTYLPLVRR